MDRACSWSLWLWLYSAFANQISHGHSRPAVWHLHAHWELDQPCSSDTLSLPRAMRESWALLQHQCLRWQWRCWDRYSTGSPLCLWCVAVWQQHRPWTELCLHPRSAFQSPWRARSRVLDNAARMILFARLRVRLLGGLLLSRILLRLAVLELLGGENHTIAGIGRIVPPLDFHPFAFQIFID
jgi:hypothetical protein